MGRTASTAEDAERAEKGGGALSFSAFPSAGLRDLCPAFAAETAASAE